MYPKVSGSVAATKAYFKEYTIYLIPDNLMMPGAAAFTRKMDGVPTCVVSDSYVANVIRRGEPVIHEACHTVLNYYVASSDDHADVTIWKVAGGENTLQYIAGEVYKELSQSLKVH